MNALNYNSLCEEAEPHYYDFICDDTRSSVPDLIIQHIEQCQHCCQKVKLLEIMLSETENQDGSERTRITITKCLELHFAYLDEHVTCQAVRPFLPALLDSTVEIKIPTPITVHLDNCEQCQEKLKSIQKFDLDQNQLWQLAQILTGQMSGDSSLEQDKMQQLQEIASQVTEKPESGVVTTFNIDKSALVEVSAESENPYSGLPIKIAVSDGKNNVDDKLSAKNHFHMLKPIAAAAIILIAIGLFFNIPTAGAATIEQIYKAIEKIKNVYITKSDPESKEPKQEKWVSRELNIYMTKTDNELVLWDINSGIRKTKSATGAVNTIPLTEGKIAGVGKKISGSIGLVPFGNISDIPADHGWDNITDKYPQAASEELEVYELTWTEKAYDGSVAFKKWRFYLDTKTHLPERTECYYKSIKEREYILQDIIVIEYLDKSEIQTVLKSVGF